MQQIHLNNETILKNDNDFEKSAIRDWDVMPSCTKRNYLISLSNKQLH